MTSGQAGGGDLVCAGCGKAVLAWPYMVVPQPDGSLATFHEPCSPWADEIARAQEGGLELLTDEERQSVIGVVTALVDRDEAALRHIGAIADDREDPYEVTRWWGQQLELIEPPRDPIGWEADVIGTPDRGWSVDVRMWTTQEGPSDLVLQLDVTGSHILYRGMRR